MRWMGICWAMELHGTPPPPLFPPQKGMPQPTPSCMSSVAVETLRAWVLLAARWRFQCLQVYGFHPYFYNTIAANTEKKLRVLRVSAAILYRTKHKIPRKIRIYTPKGTDILGWNYGLERQHVGGTAFLKEHADGQSSLGRRGLSNTWCSSCRLRCKGEIPWQLGNSARVRVALHASDIIIGVQ